MSKSALFFSPTNLALASVLLLASASAQDAAQVTQRQNSWYQQGQKTVQEMLDVQPNMNQAKNVIIFIADGADPVSITATRILAGQQKGMSGEDNILSFETFPNVALVKTYTTDAQVADSAPTAVAWNTGVKTDNGVIGVNEKATYDDCASSKGNHVTTLFELAETAGMSTGTVTTARLTHATPAANYAHTPNRNWESDDDLTDEARQQGCTDIAAQLLAFPYGDGLEVAMGGGRSNFLPDTQADPEDSEETGGRSDGRNLAQQWTRKHQNAAYVWNQKQFDTVDPATTDHLLGLFNTSHLEYEVDRADDAAGEPSLSEMTSKALDILSKNPEGYLLQVEAGRVDHALHESNAYRALNDNVEFARTIEVTLGRVDLQDTLILVSSDHGHTLGFAGYPERGNPILGLVRGIDEETGESAVIPAQDGKPYTTLGFLNGPGSIFYEEEDEEAPGAHTDALSGGAGTPIESEPVTNPSTNRPNPANERVQSKDYLQPSLVPLESETHGGTDVAAYATGPRSFLVRGVVEQNYLFHVMDYALNLTERAEQATSSKSAAPAGGN